MIRKLFKRLYRCRTCGDLHWGYSPPEVCPTCKAKGDYVPISLSEAATLLGLRPAPSAPLKVGGDAPGIESTAKTDNFPPASRKERREMFRELIEEFAASKGYHLNPDGAHLQALIESVLDIEERQGVKLCPCRLGTGELMKDLMLLCPCHFESQQIFREERRCWCGMFFAE
jgi:ferredoxin-thioredoxin reductase catalytic subunit